MRGSAEFAGPQDQCFVEQAAGFEVFDKSSDGPVSIEGVLFVPLFQIAVLVPSAVRRAGRAGDLNIAGVSILSRF